MDIIKSTWKGMELDAAAKPFTMTHTLARDSPSRCPKDSGPDEFFEIQILDRKPEKQNSENGPYSN